jgi:hypothetical protein
LVAPDAGAVAGAVVGQDPFDGDACVAEEGVGALPEAGGGLLALVGEDLAVGEAGMVVDGGVQIAVAEVGAAVVGAGPGGVAVCGAVAAAVGPTVDLVATAVGDVARFLMSTWTSSPGRSRS